MTGVSVSLHNQLWGLPVWADTGGSVDRPEFDRSSEQLAHKRVFLRDWVHFRNSSGLDCNKLANT